MMNEQAALNYQRISEALDYIRTHFKEQPGLDEIAEKVHLSPFHFQRIFTEWAGVSPKKFLQYVSVQHAKSLLRNQDATLFDTALATGLSGTSRLHDLFLTIEGMTPGEYKNGGENLVIAYSLQQSPFGTLFIGSTLKGICHVAFEDDTLQGLTTLRHHFPNAQFQERETGFHLQALEPFTGVTQPTPVKLHVKGTPFQVKVWETLLKIPLGGLSTYGTIAAAIDSPNASRAVGSAVGNNPVAFLIPCHRVIQSTGVLGQYHWGSTRKTAMIGWEAAQVEKDC